MQLTKQESQDLRDKITKEYLERIAKVAFVIEPRLKSCQVLIAQYWDDGAEDETHVAFVFSELEEPDISAYYLGEQTGQHDTVNLANCSAQYHYSIYTKADYAIHAVTEEWISYKFHEELVLAFACYCEQGYQNDEDENNYYPYCLIRKRSLNEVETTINGTMLRPHLDGVRYE